MLTDCELKHKEHSSFFLSFLKFSSFHLRKWFGNVKCKMLAILFSLKCVNTLRPRQNGRHFADAIFKCIFLNENVWIPIKISLKLVPKSPINNSPALVQIMAWHRPGYKPLSESMMVSLPTYIYVTRPQWDNSSDVVDRIFFGCQCNACLCPGSQSHQIISRHV